MLNMDGATSAVLVALINMLGSVLILWIRARYSYHSTTNGHGTVQGDAVKFTAPARAVVTVTPPPDHPPEETPV